MPQSSPHPARIDWFSALTSTALVLTLSVVIARTTMLEGFHEPFPAAPGRAAYPRGAGPTASLFLDLLCCVPALLVLVRRAADETYVVRWNGSHVWTGLLAAWVCASVAWADDKFAAAVAASHVTAAFSLLWAASQLVRSWLRLRTVAAVCFGLLLVCLAQAVVYHFVEVPDTKKNFEEHRKEFFQQQNWTEDSYFARQFEKKLESGEMMGFNGSPNSFAAVLVLLAGVSAGLVVQRLIDAGPGRFPWAGGMAVALPLTFWALFLTQSKAAFMTPLLTAAILLAVTALRPVLGRRSGAAYFAGLLLVLAAVAGVVGYGLRFHTLPTASLDFRWRYWVAAWRMFRARPVLGVGWANFGPHYLRFRLPVAAEDIQDPHNFLLKFLTELGLIGAGIGIAWLARLWWELTRPLTPPAPAGVHSAGPSKAGPGAPGARRHAKPPPPASPSPTPNAGRAWPSSRPPRRWARC